MPLKITNKTLVHQNRVFGSTEYVVLHADYVKIDEDVLARYAENCEVPYHTNWMRDSFDLSGLNEEERAMLVVVFNSVSFSYWGDPYWSVTNKNISYDRASWSMVAAILRSREEGLSILEPHVLEKLSKEELGNILRGNTEIPMLEERKNILNLVGKNIQEKGGGSILNIFKKSEGDALKLVDTILKDFSPAFDDQYEYKGETVYFNKRAQALVESLNSMFDGKGYGFFQNADKLSALADYILPNLLRDIGVLQYAEDLAKLVDGGREIEKGSAYEIEIRASVVQSIEKIRQKVSNRMGCEVQTSAINDFLWIKGGDTKTPFHKVRTTAY